MIYRALLIGNSIFEADASLNPLNAPTKDVARLHRALVDADSGMFDDDNVRLVSERKHDEILDELDAFFASGAREDLMLLYYSGHGVLDEFSNLYLCGRDTRSDRLARTGISDGTINDFIRGAASRRTVLILDCCSSGMFKGGLIGGQLAGPGRYILSSARGKSLANDAQSPTGTSLFTEHLVEGLLGGAHDLDGDGRIDLHEIYDYVKRRLAETSKQVPSIRFEGDGDVSIARSKQAPVVAIADGTTKPHHTGEAVFGLSESAIVLRDVDPMERLRPEVIEICRFTDDDLDIAAEALDGWLQAEIVGDRLLITLQPGEGHNRGKVLVRDRNSGNVQALRVEAFVRPRVLIDGEAQSELAGTKSATQPPPTYQPPTVQPPEPQPAPAYHPRPTYQAPQTYPPPSYPLPTYPPPSYPSYSAFAPPPSYQLPPTRPGDMPRKGTNGLAITAFVMSLLWLYGIGSVLAVVFAHNAKRQIARSGQGGRPLATAATVIGWIGIALTLLAILYAIGRDSSLQSGG